jgi:hypothetical protein
VSIVGLYSLDRLRVICNQGHPIGNWWVDRCEDWFKERRYTFNVSDCFVDDI